MFAKTAAIALGIIVTGLAAILLVALIPTSIGFPSPWPLTLVIYGVAAAFGGAAATLAYSVPSKGIATVIGAFLPLMAFIIHFSLDLVSALIRSVVGAAAAFVGQLLAERIRLSRTSRPRQETPLGNVNRGELVLRAAISLPVAFFVTVFVFHVLLSVAGYEQHDTLLVLDSLFIFSATVLGIIAADFISKPQSETFPLWAGLAVPAVLYVFEVASVFGIDFPYDTRLPAAVSLAVYWGFPVSRLKMLTPIQHSMLAICGIAGAYSGRALTSTRRGLLRYFVWVMPTVNCFGALALIAGIVMVVQGDEAGQSFLGAGVLTGLLGSIPTLILARLKEDKMIFRLATLSLSVSFIAILLTVAAVILAPKRGPGNDSAAVASVRTVTTAEITYQSSTGNYATIQELIAAGLLDTGFNGTKSGYNYDILSNGLDYTITAYPASTKNGRYAYYSLPDGVVRYSTQTTLAPANMAGKPVG
jgi:hypothetical protein